MGSSAKYSALSLASAVPANEDDALDEAVVELGALQAPAPTVHADADRVKVIAPAALPGGYEMPCDYQGRSVLVRVVCGVLCGGGVRFRRNERPASSLLLTLMHVYVAF
jgi:hypothetical protein